MFVSYAQNREDVILDAYFHDVKNGFYIDIGANHPIDDSVTKYFYEKGWRGINVEPIKRLFDLINEDRPDDTNLNMGVSLKGEPLVLRQYVNDGLSTFSKELKKEYSKKVNTKTAQFEDVEVNTIKLSNLFNQYAPKHVHFLKIDVEGFEYDVIKSNDWSLFRPEMLCVEANHGDSGDWRKILTSNQYMLVYDDGLNEYYLADESNMRKDNFNYVDTMLLGPQVIHHSVIEKINELSSEIKNKDIAIEIQNIHLKQLQKEKEITEKQIIEQQRFKSTIKMFVKALDKLIIARTENLRKPSRSQRVASSASRSEKVYDTTSKEALLGSIRQNDLVTFYTRQTNKIKEKKLLYVTVKFSYKGLKTIIKVPYRVAKKLLKSREVTNE